MSHTLDRLEALLTDHDAQHARASFTYVMDDDSCWRCGGEGPLTKIGCCPGCRAWMACETDVDPAEGVYEWCRKNAHNACVIIEAAGVEPCACRCHAEHLKARQEVAEENRIEYELAHERRAMPVDLRPSVRAFGIRLGGPTR